MILFFLFLFSFFAALIGTRLCRSLAHRWRVVDHPDNSVKTHILPTAYLGGVGIWLGFLSGFLGIWIIKPDWLWQLSSWPGWIAIASAIICLAGLIDDLRNISPLQKILGQSLASRYINRHFMTFRKFGPRICIFPREEWATSRRLLPWRNGKKGSQSLKDRSDTERCFRKRLMKIPFFPCWMNRKKERWFIYFRSF